MIHYKVLTKNDEFHVIENYTKQVIRIHKSNKKAMKLARFLDNGGGFHGNTPPFFLIPIASINKNV